MSESTRIAAVVIFVITYVLISIPKIKLLNLDRASAATLGAVLMIAFGVLSLDQAFKEAVNYDTILLLLGMMIIVAYLRCARFFEYTSMWILMKSKTPERLLTLIVFASGLLSALFVNDTICLTFTPIVLEAVIRARLDARPFLVALVTSANIGSVMTLVGNPQNMLVGIYSKIGYGHFFLVMAPIAMVCLLIDIWIIRWVYRDVFGKPFDMTGLEPPRMNRAVVARVFGVLALVTAGFLLPIESWLKSLEVGQKLPFVAIAGGLLVMLVGRYRPERAFYSMDWTLLLFFASLFVVIKGIGNTGLLGAVHRVFQPWFGTSDTSQALTMSAFTVVMSNIVSNVPYVLIAKEWVREFASPTLIWFIIAMASTFAGNLTIVGSVANMIVLELSKDKAPVGFFYYLKAGLPITLATVAVGTAALLAAHALGFL